MNDIIPFDKWLLNNNDRFMKMEGNCNKCDGDGVTECRCCGSEIDCDQCGGTGRFSADKPQLDRSAALVAYHAAVARDAALLAAFMK